MFNKFIPQYQPLIRRKDAKTVYKTIIKGKLGPGSETILMEEEIKKVTGAKYCVSTTSGTTALIMAIESLNLPKGSTILFPAYTFIAGANAARFMGYKVKLIDVNYNSMCMNPNCIKSLKNVSCIIFVDHNGSFGFYERESIRTICDKNNIAMIEDSAQCIGIKNAGRKGDIGIFSFSVPKLITGGQGGALITDNEKIYKKLLQIRDHGDNWRKDRIHKNIGVNFKFNDIQASYILSQLKDINWFLKKRKEIMCCYEYDGVPLDNNGLYENDSGPWMAIYKTKKADKIIKELEKNKVQAVQYYRPINDNPPYKTKLEFATAKMLFEECVYLPSSLNLKRRQIKRICNIIKAVEDSE